MGSNGSGKASVLEALHLLNSPGDLNAFGWLATKRGELGHDFQTGAIDSSHFSYRHEVKGTSPITFKIKTTALP